MSADVLLTTEDAERALKVKGGWDAGSDDLEELAVCVQAVCGLIDELCGPSTPTSYTQVVRPPVADRAYLDRAPGPGGTPVLAVTSVTGPDGGLVAASSYYVDLDLWAVRFPYGLSGQASEAYVVAYTAGRESVPAPLKLAARSLLKSMWSERRGSGGRDGGGLEPNAGGIAVSAKVVEALGVIPPKRALLMLGPYLKGSGFA